MVLTSRTQNLLDDLQKLLVINEEEIVQRGIAQATTDRIIELRQRISQLGNQYGDLGTLESEIEKQGVPADDHALYTDLLEWRAIRHEMEQLTHFLENA